MSAAAARERPLIAFFDYPDVFEDFYPHYGVDQQAFATRWADTGNHALLTLLQREVGDVIWYAFSLAPRLALATHQVVGCRVRLLPSSWLHRRLWHGFYGPRAAWRWRRAYPAFALAASYTALLSTPFLRTLARDRPDILFVQDYATGRFDCLVALARLLRTPLIAYHSGSRPDRYVGKRLKRWTIRAADRLIVSSRGERDLVTGRFGARSDRVHIVLTPVDTTRYRVVGRGDACRTAALDPARRYLLFVGRLDDAVKRVSTIIASFAHLAEAHPDVDLLILGDGSDAARLRHQAAALPPRRVRFLGWVSDVDRKVSLYNTAECLVLASRTEGFPTVVGEALACGTPVLASRVGGVGEVVEEGRTGWLVPSGDGAALTDKLAHVLRQPGMLGTLRRQARAVAEQRLASDVVATQLGHCFQEALRARSNAPAHTRCW